jgi:predicted AlkP superfamily pyrophosphatase or phosphodiesterase
VTWPVTVGAAVTFRVPEYWRVGTPDDQKLLRALSTPGLLDKVARAEPALWKSLVPPDVKDAAQFAIARYLIANERVDLMLVHGWELDDAQHDHGPRSPEAKRAIENADRLLGELLATIDKSAVPTIVVIVSDHGFAAIEHEIRPYVVLAERGLVGPIPEKAPPPGGEPKLAVSANGGIALVYVLDPAIRPQLADAIAAVPHVAKVIPKSELAALGADPDAEWALVAEPTYAFSEKRGTPSVVDTPGKGTHGYPPSDPAMSASFIAVGPGVPARDLGTIRMIDIAPTLARWLDVPFPTATGTAIHMGATK